MEKLNKLSGNPVIQAIVLLILIYLLLPNSLSSYHHLCETDKILIGSCLDSSWVLSLNLAMQESLVFGKDYVFTYGALGFLSTRNTLGLNPLILVLFDVFIVANLAYALFYTIRRYCKIQTILLCFLITYTIASHSMYGDQIPLILLLISFFWVNYSLKESKVWSFTIPIIAICLSFYIKLSISLAEIIVFYGYLVYFLFSDRKNYLPKILIGLCLPLLIFLLSFPLQTDLTGYIRGGLSLTDGFNDAMSLKIGEYSKFFNIALILVVAFFITFIGRNIKTQWILLLSGLFLTFITYKQAFVRADLHILIFFTIFPAICSIILVFYEEVSKLRVIILTGICVTCLVIGLYFDVYPSIAARTNYLSSIISSSDTKRYENNFNRFELPVEARDAIGENSVDIIPWNIDYLHFNRLKYTPRPVIQSYAAYTPYLIDLNKQKYKGDSAPSFVIFSNQSIDNRYSLFDDQEVKLALIKDYSCIKFFDLGKENKFLLFQRNPNNTTINYSPAIEKSIKFSQRYDLENSDKSYFLKFNINYSLFGKALRTIYRPPQVLINFTLEDGSIRLYRAIVPILNSGVLINPLIEEEEDFFNFVQGTPIPKTKKIKSLEIKLDSQRIINEATYDKNINFSISEVSIVKNK